MDDRCPACKADLGKGWPRRAIVVRMDADWGNCKSTICLNVHQAEVFVVLLGFGIFIALVVFAYWFRSQEVMLAAPGAAMVGAAASPPLEQVYSNLAALCIQGGA